LPVLKKGVIEDLKALPTPELRELVFRLLLAIEEGRVVGKPLDDLAHVGDLSDCFKVSFDHLQLVSVQGHAPWRPGRPANGAYPRVSAKARNTPGNQPRPNS